MKKLFTLFAAIATTVALNAATVEWTVDDLGWPKGDNNKELAGETVSINNNISLSFSNGEGTSPVIYRLTSNDEASYIAFYSKNVITVNAVNATITNITFVVDQDSDNAKTTQSTPGWSVKIGNTTYNIDSPIWSGNAASVEVTGNSKTALLGLNIEYNVTGGTTEPENPGSMVTYIWAASDLSGVSNNDVLNDMTFDINDVLSFTLAKNDSDKDIIFKKTSSAPTTINIYSKGSISIAAAEGATIQSIKFIVNTSEGTSNTPGWNLQTEDKTSYTAENDTWTGSENEITFTDKSAIQLMGLEIVYLTSGDDEENGDDEGNNDTTDTSYIWNASDLTELANNDVLNDMTFDINDVLSFTLAKNDSDKDIIFKKTSSAPTTINIYSKGSISFMATKGTTITSIKFIVNTSEGTSNTPGWNLQTEDKTSYTAENDTWTGSENEITFTDKSAIQLMGLEIAYTTPTGISETIVTDFENMPAYDLFGRKVSDEYRGLVIQGGRKFIRK